MKKDVETPSAKTKPILKKKKEKPIELLSNNSDVSAQSKNSKNPDGEMAKKQKRVRKLSAQKK